MWLLIFRPERKNGYNYRHHHYHITRLHPFSSMM
uniref:Uncharacterized protein n=1 Tax=Arundo donax TaxID=35708 RepID=A0A0A8Z503_ARUDO